MTAEIWPLRPYLPPNTNAYCFAIWRQYRFEIKITAPRRSKLGDYRYDPRNNTHKITINRNLNPYTFLLVFLHEAAHCHTTIHHGLKQKAHGKRWQNAMRELTRPLLKDDLFPTDIQLALQNYLEAPKASNCSHPQLTKALRKYDPVTDLVPLEELPDGLEFFLQKKQYRRLCAVRSRVRCLDCKTKRVYLVPKLALVQPLQH